MIPIFQPYLSKIAKKNLNVAINTNWISSQGNFILKFEEKLKKFHNMKYCLVTSSCTSALHLSILSFDFKEGDEIICPSLSFIAPANMIVLSKLKLVLVDIDKDTLNLDLNKVEKKITKKTKAILVVHQFGHSADMEKLIALKKKYKLKIIEDNAESLGGMYKNKINGTFGDITTLSFFANKIITTGEGGAVLTNNKKLYLKCKEMRDHGMSIKKRYFHTRMGFNYRMTNMQAAVGLSQINEIKNILKIRKQQMNLYYSLLKNETHFVKRKFKKWCLPVHWLMTITLKKNNLRNKLIKYLKKKGIEARPMINPIEDALHLKQYRDKKQSYVARKTSVNSVHLPSSTSLSVKQINHICSALNSYFQKN
jgi:perosamine synthetase|tara:strand:+ start:7859 stop:8959 length:1101 start_codon:yes stop_codon:yes gene_type:complete